MSVGQVFADKVAATVGSWNFIIIQSTIIVIWITLNSTGVLQWDPYPFILLNLTLSFQAAYTAPFIMMSQNRQADIDRAHAEEDFQINKLAEKEIEDLQAQFGLLESKVATHQDLKEDLIQIKKQLEHSHRILELIEKSNSSINN